MNSFKFLAEGMAAEIERQIGVLEGGGTVEQETLHYDPRSGALRSLRSKEEAHDYRYFPEPDLVPLAPSAELIERLRGRAARAAGRAHRPLRARLFAARAVRGRPQRRRRAWRTTSSRSPSCQATPRPLPTGSSTSRRPSPAVPASGLAGIVKLVNDGTITATIAKQVYGLLEETPDADPAALVEEQGLASIGGDDELMGMVDEVIEANPALVEQFRGGKDGVVNALVGQVMKKTQGRADARKVQDLFRSRL